MAGENPTHISDLDATRPGGGEDANLTDDYLNDIKSVLKTDFAAIAGAVTASHTELNYLDGATAGTVVASKAVVAGSGKDISFGNDGGITDLQFLEIQSGNPSYTIDNSDAAGTDNSKWRWILTDGGAFRLDTIDSAGSQLDTVMQFVRTMDDTGALTSLLLQGTGGTIGLRPEGGTLILDAVTGGAGNVQLTLGSDDVGDIYYRNSSGYLEPLAKGTPGQALFVNSGATAPEWGHTDFARFEYHTASNTNDATSLVGAAWTLYPLTRESDDEGSNFTFATSVITVTNSGTYRVRANVGILRGSGCQIRLRRTSGGGDTLLTSDYDDIGSDTYGRSKLSMRGRVSLTAADTLEVQYWMDLTTSASLGANSVSNTGEEFVWGWIELVKE